MHSYPLLIFDYADHQKPLMCNGGKYILDTSRMLVKAEWDKAEEWLIENPDERQNENNE